MRPTHTLRGTRLAETRRVELPKMILRHRQICRQLDIWETVGITRHMCAMNSKSSRIDCSIVSRSSLTCVNSSFELLYQCYATAITPNPITIDIPLCSLRFPYQSSLLKYRNNLPHCLLHPGLPALHHYLCLVGFLIRCAHSCKFLDFPRSRLLIQPFRISSFGDFE